MQTDNEKMLQEIVQNTEMGKNTLDELMGLTHDQRLKDEMMRQKREYRRINQAAHTALDAIGAEAQGQSAAARMSVSMGIRTRTMMDKSTRNLATMLAEGSGQGVLDCKRAEKTIPPPAPVRGSFARNWANSNRRPRRPGGSLFEVCLDHVLPPRPCPPCGRAFLLRHPAIIKGRHRMVVTPARQTLKIKSRIQTNSSITNTKTQQRTEKPETALLPARRPQCPAPSPQPIRGRCQQNRAVGVIGV